MFAPNSRTVDGPCYRAPVDANGRPLPVDGEGRRAAAVVRTVEEAVEACYLGMRPHALKRGRHAAYPYVPVVLSPRHDIGRPDLTSQRQIVKRAYPTREAAVEYAQRTIDLWRDHFRKQLFDPRFCALREQWGVPHEVAGEKAVRLAAQYRGDGWL